MEKKIFKAIITALISFSGFLAEACGWYEIPESYRISVFRIQIAELSGYQSFFYTPETLNRYLPEFNNEDRMKNCMEWQQLINEKIRVEDIFTILYKVEPDMFFLAYNDNTLGETFEGNTFIEQLLSEKNKHWLDYLVFSKKNEYNNQYLNDPWNYSYSGSYGHISDELIKEAHEKVKGLKNSLIKERYAFHLIRLYDQTARYAECIKAYDAYFSGQNNNSILKQWCLIHKANALHATGQKVEANYFYSLVFNAGEEKRIRAFQLFDKELFEPTLKMAKNKDEIAGLWAIMAIKNPGPALNEIRKVIENQANHPSIPLLFMREVNKLEDWIFTPELTAHGPALHGNEGYNEWDENYEQIKNINRKKDEVYLKEFVAYLETVQAGLDKKLTDFVKLARAHLHLIIRENKEALQLFNLISTNADKAIQKQKNTELVLFYAFENGLDKPETKEKLAQSLLDLEKLAKYDVDSRKQLQSLYEFVSRTCLKNGDVASAGLLKLKSEFYKDDYYGGRNDYEIYWDREDYYWYIAYFDRFAGPTDIDHLISLIEKKNKTNFEKLICDQKLPNKNALLDLKGTIALRLGDLQTASQAFSNVPHDYWEKTYEFYRFLDESPFIVPNMPKPLEKDHFNKADMLKKLVALEQEAQTNKMKASENYIQLGKFYYNASYMGNSWMMLSYCWTSAPRYGSTTFAYHDVLFGDLVKNAKGFESSYYMCKPALDYFKKAENANPDKEQLAMIYFMKYCCSYNRYISQERMKDWNAEPGIFEPLYISDLYKYKNTETFRQVHCPMLDDFAFSLGIGD